MRRLALWLSVVLIVVAAVGCSARAQPPGAAAVVVLHTFSGGDGATPKAPLLAVGNDFYGTTSVGGQFRWGTIFRVSRTGVFTSLYSFLGLGDGGLPERLVLGPDGAVYGTTAEVPQGPGQPPVHGTFFRIAPSGALQALYVFSRDADGYAPGSGVNGMPCDHGDIFSFSLAGELRGGGTGIEGCGSFGLDFQTVDGSIFGSFVMTEHCCPTTVVRLSPEGVVADPTAFPTFSSELRLTDGGDSYAYGVTFGNSPSDPGSIFKMSLLGTPKPPTNVRLTPG